MGELIEILGSINEHCTVENREGYKNLSIGRGEIMMRGMRSPKVIWIINSDTIAKGHRVTYNFAGSAIGTDEIGLKNQYFEPGTTVVPKNRQYARLILGNYEGCHTCQFMNGPKEFLIKSSAHYINNRKDVTNIQVGVSGMKDWNYFTTLKRAIEELNRTESEIEIKKNAEEEVKRKVEELRRKQQAEEVKRLAQEEAMRLEEETRKAEEELRKLNIEIENTQKQREQFLQEASRAAAFIRQQVSLRRNPVLDKYQDKAKFSNLYNGTAEIINGGPGTGKTTTLIQRLKLLIDRGDLEDYMENNNDCKLTNKQLDVISSSIDNWIYFSPNDLLKKYLQDNMSYEGLPNANHRTVVWKTYLKDAVRDEYHIAGEGCPFDFAKRKKEDISIFTGDHIEIINNFCAFYLNRIKDSFIKISRIDTSKFEWKILGSVITKECAKIESVTNIDDLMLFLFNMERIDNNIVVNGQRLKSGSEITNDFNAEIRNLTDKYITILKRDEIKYNELVEFINTQTKTTTVEVDEVEDVEDTEPDYGDVSIVLYNKLNALLKKLCLKTKDNNVKITTAQKQLYELFKDCIRDEDITKLADAAFFAKHINPVLKGFGQYMLSPIPQYYKAYRKSLSDTAKIHWNNDVLTEILEYSKNRMLLCQEQALLVGFINHIAKTLYKLSKDRFDKSTHKYVVAYKNLCRPVIGIDEATDYSIIDFYAIKSFGHYEVCSYTLSGDTMQLMKDDGIRDWDVLQNPLIFEKIDVHNLKMSYRQSAELLSLADKIYQVERGEASPYECFIKEEKTPSPLWIENNDIDEKAEWISERVMEIIKTYNCVPTIAVFTINKRVAEELKEALDECDNLVRAGIEVKVCSDNTLEGDKTLRIFPIDQVKGMEFEAVFFYDIDEIESTSLINKYLYVGLSRASMYLAVTSNGRSQKISNMLQKYFTTDTTWR
jgi:hypothetical protein